MSRSREPGWMVRGKARRELAEERLRELFPNGRLWGDTQ